MEAGLSYNLNVGGEMDSTEVVKQKLQAEVPSTSLNRWEKINCRTCCSRCLIESAAVSASLSCGPVETPFSRIVRRVCSGLAG